MTAHRRHPVPVPRGPPPAVVGRPRHPGGDRPLHARGAARCAVVPLEHRVHPPGERPRDGRRRPPHRLRRLLPRARPRRRVPRRTGGHPARPPAPPGHDQVQPGPHLDRRELRRHRRRLPVHLRDGGPGRLPVRRTNRAGVEPRRPRAALRPSRGCCAPFDQIRWYPVEADELLDLRAQQAERRPADPHRGHDVPAAASTRASSPPTPSRSTRSAPPSRPPSPPSAPPGPPPASSTGDRTDRRPPRSGRGSCPWWA